MAQADGPVVAIDAAPHVSTHHACDLSAQWFAYLESIWLPSPLTERNMRGAFPIRKAVA
jgi:hypothetical protein